MHGLSKPFASASQLSPQDLSFKGCFFTIAAPEGALKKQKQSPGLLRMVKEPQQKATVKGHSLTGSLANSSNNSTGICCLASSGNMLLSGSVIEVALSFDLCSSMRCASTTKQLFQS